MLPFSRDQFLAVFVAYNDAIWPAQVAAYLLGAVAVALALRPAAWSGRVVAAILAAMWLWTGIAYHVVFFTAINRPAYGFGGLFVVEAALFAWWGVVGDRLRFGFRPDVPGWAGIALAVYAAILYPLIAIAGGHAYPAMPVFGVTPCPVTLFTFGLLLLTRAPVPRWLLVIPFVWSLIGGSAAVLLGIASDWVLLVSGVVAVPLIVMKDRRDPSSSRP
jgi:hypothetical protein